MSLSLPRFPSLPCSPSASLSPILQAMIAFISADGFVTGTSRAPFFADDGASNEGTQAFLDTGSAGASAVKGEALLQEPLRVRTQGSISATAPAHFGGLGGRRMYSTSR